MGTLRCTVHQQRALHNWLLKEMVRAGGWGCFSFLHARGLLFFLSYLGQVMSVLCEHCPLIAGAVKWNSSDLPPCFRGLKDISHF